MGTRVIFGKWEPHLKLLNKKYDRLIDKICKFAQEAGIDPYGRYFVAEAFIDFILAKGHWSKSIEYMYRHFVYFKLSQVQEINIEQIEMIDLEKEFYLIPSTFLDT